MTNRSFQQTHTVQMDERIIEQVLRGETWRFEDLMRAHETKVRGVVRRYLENSEDIQDVLQVTWMKAWTKLSHFQRKACFSTWVTRIAINEALQVHRRGAARRTVQLDEAQSHGALQFRTPMHGASQEPYLLTRLRQLPEPYGSTMLLHGVMGLSDKEISERKAVSVAATKSRLHRARKMLREDWLGAPARQSATV